MLSERPQGSLLRNTEPNPREQVKAVTLRSGRELQSDTNGVPRVVQEPRVEVRKNEAIKEKQATEKEKEKEIEKEPGKNKEPTV